MLHDSSFQILDDNQHIKIAILVYHMVSKGPNTIKSGNKLDDSMEKDITVRQDWIGMDRRVWNEFDELVENNYNIVMTDTLDKIWSSELVGTKRPW